MNLELSRHRYDAFIVHFWQSSKDAIITFFLLSSVLFIALANAAGVDNQEGITLQSTRVVYSEKAKNGITFTVANDTEQPYLMQARVLPWVAAPENTQNEQHAQEVPFVVLPPLQRFEPNEKLTLRIRLTNNMLPTDRESVFVLSLKAIPRQAPSNEVPQLVLAMQNNLKLFYRPKGLPEYNLDQLARQLRFRQRGQQLLVTNLSPFYVTFRSLSMGGAFFDAKALSRWVLPFGEQFYPIPVNAQGEIAWQLIDGVGRVTPERYSSLTPSSKPQ